MNFEKLQMYELMKEEGLDEIHSTGYYLKHKKSGAKVAVLENDDRNKVFYIAFRTPLMNNTGVQHIMEHSVLMGSERYPLKDPFMKLDASSLNTYLNAMTYSDKTMYPVASCNDKDFKNLMSVYADAVFCPGVLTNDKAFRQEGWSVQLEDENAEIAYNGVVYNEMKGAYSSCERVMYKELAAAIFPDTNYAYDSGGNPEEITELSYEEFVRFHKEYYHPSNSYIYLYGNADMEERLLWLDKEYLCRYEKINVDFTMPVRQKPFDAQHEKKALYSVMENESTAEKTNLTYAVCVDDVLDIKLFYAMQVLSYALVGAPGSPVEKALYDAGIGRLVYGSTDSTLQGYFEITAKNTDEERKGEFVRVIMDTLKEVVRTGLDKKTLEAGIHTLEFQYKEQDFGRFPAGLVIGIGMLQSWLYDDDRVFDFYKLGGVFDFLKKQIDTGYYEKLIEKYIIDNTHAVLLVTAPKAGLAAEQEKRIAEKLKIYRNSLDKRQLKELVEATKELRAYQEEEDSPEALATLPRLAREDIDTKMPKLYLEERNFAKGTKLLYHAAATNGIGYLKLAFDCGNVPRRLIQYLPLLGFMGSLDTANYPYSELSNEIMSKSGGIYINFAKYGNVNNHRESATAIVVQAKALYDRLPFVMEMIGEMVFNTDWRNDKRLKEVLSENRTSVETRLKNSPHMVALTRGLSEITPDMAYKELTENIEYYRFIRDITDNFEDRKGKFVTDINELIHMVFRPENLLVSFCGSDEELSKIEQYIISFKERLFTDNVEKKKPEFVCTHINEGIKMDSQVQYVGRFGNYLDAGFEYDGALAVAKNILEKEYLYQNIRVKGGAYGALSTFGRTGNIAFISYRDPNLESTNRVYEKIPEYLKGFAATEEKMTEYIIGVIGGLDVPYTPGGEAQRAFDIYMSGLTEQAIQKARDEIIACDAEKIRSLAPLFEAVTAQNRICAIGDSAKIEASDLFDRKIKLEA